MTDDADDADEETVDTIDLFRCDYCGNLSDRNAARIYWTLADRLDDERQLYVPAVYCTVYCGRSATTAVGSGRG